jgi:LacI family transcriptional regulator
MVKIPKNYSITLKRIADELSVSVTTVSRALSGNARRYRIGRATEQKVQELARSLGFTPNPLARGLRLKKTTTIGLVIPDISNPFFAAIARQVAVGAHDVHYSVVVCDSQNNEDIEIESLELLRARGVEGIVLCPVGLLADRYFPGIPLPYVASDNFAGARTATNYLIENGHRDIVCLQGLRGTSPNEDRLRGYQDALRNHAIPSDASLIVGDSFGEQSGYVTTKLLLKTARRFTAILAFSNLISLGAIRAIVEEGLRIPEDMSIVSFDDQPYSAHLVAPLTTVAQSTVEMGQIALKLLLDRIQSTDHTFQGGILLPTNLVVRASVKNYNSMNNEGTNRHVCG